MGEWEGEKKKRSFPVAGRRVKRRVKSTEMLYITLHTHKHITVHYITRKSEGRRYIDIMYKHTRNTRNQKMSQIFYCIEINSVYKLEGVFIMFLLFFLAAPTLCVVLRYLGRYKGTASCCTVHS